MNKKHIVVFDIDGTLADCSARVNHLMEKPKNWDAFFANMEFDSPNQSVVEICRAMYNHGFYVLLCTGRYERHRTVTEDWLRRHDIPYHEIRMRQDGDKRSDVDVKREMIAEDELGKVLFIVEDRNRVVSMWRSLGVVCLQCDDGDF